MQYTSESGLLSEVFFTKKIVFVLLSFSIIKIISVIKELYFGFIKMSKPL